MNFESHFPALEAFASRKMLDKDHSMTSTEELASLLGITLNEAVGAYEAYNRKIGGLFEFEREYHTNYENFEWSVSIKKKK